MGNPIQYHNTDNKGGFHKTASVRPPGRTQRGVNENVSPELTLSMWREPVSFALQVSA